MSDETDIKESVKDPVKNLTKEIVGDIVYRIAKACTKRAIKELKEELKEKGFRRLQQRLKNILESEEKTGKKLHKSIEQVVEETSKDSARRIDFVRGIEQAFGEGAKKSFTSLSKVLTTFQTIVITTSVIAIGGTGASIPFIVKDTVPPEVTVSHSPGPGRQVTFTARATDNDAIDRIELLVDGRVLKTCSSSPCTYVGGPYPEGTTVNYAANAYDKAGNSTGTGNRYLGIEDTTPPEVTVSHSPGPGRQVTFTAKAWDNIAVDRIELLVDGRVVKTCSSSPCTYVGGPYPEGTTVNYAAKAYDKAGNSTGTGNRYLGIEDTTPPEVDVSHSLRPDRQVTFTAGAWDNIAIGRIEMLVDGRVVKTCSSSLCTYVGGPYPEGTTVSYAAKAYDKAGNSTGTGNRYLGIEDTTPPEVTVSYSPGPGRQVTFTAGAWDNVAIDRIELLVDGHVVKTCSSSPCTFVGGPYPEGTTVSYEAKAYDKAGNGTGTGNRYLGIADTTPPEVTVSHSPGPGRQVTFTARAWDNIAVGRIELLVDGHVVKTCSSSPCTFVGGPYPGGTTINYAANAIDEAGNSTSTSSKSVYISTRGVNVSDLCVAAGGETIYVTDRESGKIYRLTNAGVSWTELTKPTGATEPQLVAGAPDDDDVVAIVADDNEVYISTDGGTTWASLGRPEDTGAASAADAIYSLDVGPAIGGGTRYILAGGEDGGAAGLWYFNLGGTIPSWVDAASQTAATQWDTTNFEPAEAVWAAKFSPSFPSDRTVVVVTGPEPGTAADTQVRIQLASFAGETWNDEFYGTQWVDAGVFGREIESIDTGTVVLAASISMPDSYMGSDESTRVVFIGLATDDTAGQIGNIYRFDDEDRTRLLGDDADDQVAIRSVAINSDATDLVAGEYDNNNVWRSADPLVKEPTVSAALSRPGGENKVVVAWAGNDVVAGTSGDGSGFAISTDNGKTFNDRD